MSDTRGKQTPPDAVAKLQRVGIVDIILWLVLRLCLGSRQAVKAGAALTLSGFISTTQAEIMLTLPASCPTLADRTSSVISYAP
jgi:hypothetical protein